MWLIERIKFACIISPKTGLTKSFWFSPVWEHCKTCMHCQGKTVPWGWVGTEVHHSAFSSQELDAAEREMANCVNVRDDAICTVKPRLYVPHFLRRITAQTWQAPHKNSALNAPLIGRQGTRGPLHIACWEMPTE